MNSTHPSTDELTRFGGGDLAGEDLLTIDDHVASCDECRANLQRTLLAEAADRWQQTLEEPVSHPRGRRWVAVAASAAAAAAAIVVLLLMPREHERPPQARVTPTRPAATQPIVPAVTSLPPELQRVADQILDGSLPSRGIVRLLNPPPGPSRGEEHPDHSIRLTTPVGVVVEEDRPRFVWSQPAGAEWSRVEVFDANLRRVAAGEKGTAEQWQPAEPLRRGETYLWQVRVSRQGKIITAPAPPLPPARFKIVGAEAEKELQAARASGARLELALLYAREGKLGEARAELDALAAANPENELPRKLADALR